MSVTGLVHSLVAACWRQFGAAASFLPLLMAREAP
jgi:hypothetical protein